MQLPLRKDIRLYEIKFLVTEWSLFEFKIDTPLREQGKYTSLLLSWVKPLRLEQ